MKTNQVTGVFRRLDELGRIVLPKEFRRAMRLLTNDLLEVILSDNNIIIRKYQPLKDIQYLCKQYLLAYAKNSNVPCIICGTDTILAVRGVSLSTSAKLADRITDYIRANQTYHYNKDHTLDLLDDGKYPVDSIYPISLQDQPAGAVILLHYRHLTEQETCYAKFLADLLSQAIQEVE